MAVFFLCAHMCALVEKRVMPYILGAKGEFNMQVEQIPVSALVPYENNPRKNDEAVGVVAASIREFGFRVPIIVDKNNVIVAGHTRLKAAQKLGLDTVSVIRADDMTDEQIRAFRLADNKTAEAAGWDFAALEEELANIDLDMSQFGFDTAVDTSILDNLFAPAEEKEKTPQRIQCPHCGEWFDA